MEAEQTGNLINPAKSSKIRDKSSMPGTLIILAITARSPVKSALLTRVVKGPV